MNIDEEWRFFVQLVFWINEVEFVSLLRCVFPVFDIQFTLEAQFGQQCTGAIVFIR